MVPDSFLCFCNMKSCEDMVCYARSVGSLTDRADIDLSKIGYKSRGDGRLVLYDYRRWKQLIFWQYRLVNSLGLWFSQVLVFEFTILGGFLSISPWGSIALDSWPRARIYDRNTGHVWLYNCSILIPLLLLYENLWGHGVLSLVRREPDGSSWFVLSKICTRAVVMGALVLYNYRR